MTRQSFPDDGTMHSHGNYLAMSTPEFANVVAGKGGQPGLVTLYWSSQSCFDEMAKAMERLRIILAGWNFDPHVHSVVYTQQLGELDPEMMHGLPFTSQGEKHTLSSHQLDTICTELEVSRRYPGEIIATPIILGDGAPSHQLTARRIVHPGKPFVKCTDFTEASQRFHEEVNLELTQRMGGKEGPTTVTAKQVWSHGSTILAGMNAHLLNVTLS